MENLTTTTTSHPLLIPPEILADASFDMESFLNDELLRRLQVIRAEEEDAVNVILWGDGSPGPQGVIMVTTADTPIVVEECPDECDRCGKTEGTSPFSGWRHDPGECEYLCGDCFETAMVEE